MRTPTLAALVLAALLVATSAVGRAQDASPVVAGCYPAVATPVAVETPVATPGATPGATVATVSLAIAASLDRIFACLSARDWAGVALLDAIPAGQPNPFATLRSLEESGLLAVSTGLVSQTVRASGEITATVDLAWRIGSQLRYERWSFSRADGEWRVVLVEPGIPLYDGVIVGISGRIEPGGIVLSRSELLSPGGVEVRLDVAPVVAEGHLLLMFPRGACGRAEAAALTAALEVSGRSVTLSLDDVDDGEYALVLIPAEAAASRQAICAATAAVVKITSYEVS